MKDFIEQAHALTDDHLEKRITRLEALVAAAGRNRRMHVEHHQLCILRNEQTERAWQRKHAVAKTP